MSALSQFETDEANALMTRALTAMDMMNNAIELQNEVSPAAGAKLWEQVCLAEWQACWQPSEMSPADTMNNAIDRHPSWALLSSCGSWGCCGGAVLTAASLHTRHGAPCHVATEQQDLQRVSVFLNGVLAAVQSYALPWS